MSESVLADKTYTERLRGMKFFEIYAEGSRILRTDSQLQRQARFVELSRYFIGDNRVRPKLEDLLKKKEALLHQLKQWLPVYEEKAEAFSGEVGKLVHAITAILTREGTQKE